MPLRMNHAKAGHRCTEDSRSASCPIAATKGIANIALASTHEVVISPETDTTFFTFASAVLDARVPHPYSARTRDPDPRFLGVPLSAPFKNPPMNAFRTASAGSIHEERHLPPIYVLLDPICRRPRNRLFLLSRVVRRLLCLLIL